MNNSFLERSCPAPNSLYYGDCLDVLQKWHAESADLIYLDPPFNSDRDYNPSFEGIQNRQSKPAPMRAFSDIWRYSEEAEHRLNVCKADAHPASKAVKGLSDILPHKSPMMTYLTYMAERLSEMKRVLKKTGSIYLHCDQTASHYLKIIMDSIFGINNFKNEIIWSYSTGGAGKYWFRRKHDTILFYTLAVPGEYTFNLQKEKSYSHGKFGYSNEQYQDEEGRWYTTPRMSDVWNISAVGKNSAERTGYPTQKPEKLIDRIIEASSDPGDLVLDPFCGSGTTLASAYKMGRKWTGIDISPIALFLAKRTRMADADPAIFGFPRCLEEAERFAAENPDDYEKWAASLVPGFSPIEIQEHHRISAVGNLLESGNIGEKSFAAMLIEPGNSDIGGIEEFARTIKQNKAALGVYVSIKKKTAESVFAAQKRTSGLSVGDSRCQKIVFWSIEDYFEGIQPLIPEMCNPFTMKSFSYQPSLIKM